ncbi:piggyBac transposable element-derived protein 1 isoform X4 [Pteropus medius]|uniref:piggyBac transposable element-derived protein 1 isoform X4 n=1 Tax=Pteropus vampyrus TaxID=132908 RepID=UPI00196B39CA|nr:piggyBac transposable element-derived protein 1 isoform X4 [Pteropus giganteus]
MEQGVPGPRPRGRVRVKEEPPAGCARPAPEGRGRSPEHCRLRFRGFRYPEARGPREALRRLRQLCRLWLRPETHSKEQIVELLVLEQFLAVLPAELRARVRGRCPESGEEALAALEDAETDADTRDAAQQGQDMHLLVTDYEGASLECQSLQLLPGVPTLKCEPPELPQENLQEVHGIGED